MVLQERSPFDHTVESIQKKGNTEKFYFYLRHDNKLKKVNLDRAFAESRSGMIAHKNQKRITAGTHYETTFPYILLCPTFFRNYS
jgi:hypothetical protein